jgi:hypothetical protein
MARGILTIVTRLLIAVAIASFAPWHTLQRAAGGDHVAHELFRISIGRDCSGSVE